MRDLIFSKIPYPVLDVKTNQVKQMTHDDRLEPQSGLYRSVVITPPHPPWSAGYDR